MKTILKMLFVRTFAYMLFAHASLALAGIPVEKDLMTSNLGVPPQWKGWDRMTVSAPGHMSKTKTIQVPDFLKAIWAREIAENDKHFAETNPDLLYKDGHASADALWSVYKDGGRTIIVSLLDTPMGCESGPNDYRSTQIHSTCPVRITVQRGGESRSVDYSKGCFLDISFGNPPGGPDPLTNASLTRFDRKAGVIDLIAIRDNQSLPDCAKRLKVPNF